MASISSWLSSTSKTSKFSSMRSLRTDLGIATIPRSSLGQPAQYDLRNGLLVFSGEGQQDFVLEDVVLAFREWCPGFMLNPVGLQEFLGFDLLMERMGFDLVHRRHHFVVHHQVHQPVGLEVADPDGSYRAFPVQLFHGSPSPMHIPEGLVNQVQINMLQLQPLQRPVKRLLGAFVSGIRDPELGGDEQLFSWHTCPLDSGSDDLFIAISSRGIDQTIARTYRVVDASFAFLGIRYLKNAEPQEGHLHTVIERD